MTHDSPSCCAQVSRDGTFELAVVAQFSKRPRASIPTVSKLALTPHMSAVAHADDSPTWASALYVCKTGVCFPSAVSTAAASQTDIIFTQFRNRRHWG